VFKRKYDAPRPGYVRYTVYVKSDLLKDLKTVANLEKKTVLQAVEEALKNWTYYDESKDETSIDSAKSTGVFTDSKK
jgi:hypothetical protein